MAGSSLYIKGTAEHTFDNLVVMQPMSALGYLVQNAFKAPLGSSRVACQGCRAVLRTRMHSDKNSASAI